MEEKLSMAKIILISRELKRPNNSIGDIVDIYDDDVELGPSYDLFTIKMVPGTAANVAAMLEAKRPQVKEVDAVDVWFDKLDKTWKKLVENPKYDFNYVSGDISSARNKIKDYSANLQKVT